MPDFLVWPKEVLDLGGSEFTPVASSQTGGRSFGGTQITTRTDTGFWKAELGPIKVYTDVEWRVWEAIQTELGGRVGIIAVPANVRFGAPYVGGVPTTSSLTTHSDGTTFTDGTKYRTRSIDVQMATAASLGSTVVTLEAINAGDDLTGVYFSYQYALYKTGSLISKTGNLWQMRVFPAIRQAIPAGASLELDEPMCLMHLATDTEMSIRRNPGRMSTPTIQLEEAVDYWNYLAVA